jgi:hypothetical protein
LSWRPLGFNQRFPEVTAIASAMTAMWNLIPKERVGIALGGGAAASKPAGSRGVTSHLYILCVCVFVFVHTYFFFKKIYILYVYIGNCASIYKKRDCSEWTQMYGIYFVDARCSGTQTDGASTWVQVHPSDRALPACWRNNNCVYIYK